MHTRKGDGKSFVDGKAKGVNDQVTEVIQERQERSEEIDVNRIFLEVAAGKRSDRVYGLGAFGVEYFKTKKYELTGDTFGVYTAKLENEVKDLKQVVTNVTQELKEAKQQMEQTQLQIEERIQQIVRDVISKM